MSDKLYAESFDQWYSESGAEKMAQVIQERVGCTRGAALQILLLMDIDNMFIGEVCPTCGHDRSEEEDDDDSAIGL